MQNFRSSFFLLVLVLAGFAYLFFVDRHLPSTDEQNQSEKMLFKFNINKVTSLKFINGDLTVDLEKSADTWNIKSPVATEADSAVVHQVLGELQDMQSRRTIEFKDLKGNQDTLANSGLAPASTKIEFSTGNGPDDKYVLFLGRKIVASDYVYARNSAKDDAPVYLISTSSRDAIDKKLDDLRSRVVFNVDRTKVDLVGLRMAGLNNQGGVEYEVARQKDTWVLQKPLTARAETAKINQWLQRFDDMRVVKFVTDDGSSLNQYGLNTPAYELWFQGGDKNNISTLLIGSFVPGQKDQVYAKRLKGDGVFTLSQPSLEPLLQGLPNSREKHLLSINPAQVSELQFETKGKVIGMKRDKDGWVLEGTNSLRADSSKITSAIDDLGGLQTLSFVNDAPSDLKPYGLDKPQQKVTLIGSDGDKQETIELFLGKADKQQIFARTSLESFIYSLPLNVADKWPKDAMDWRDLGIFNFGADKITQITVTPSTGNPFSYEQNGTGEFKAGETGKVVNVDKARKQLAALALLRAEKWLGSPQPTYGLSKPRLKIEIKTDSPKVLLIGDDLPTGKAAQIEGGADCFEINLSDYSVLQDSPIEAAPVAAPAQAVKK